MSRVVVIGAGHSGLVAAIHLAGAGLDVTLLEHAPRPGGATASFSHDGFVHDHCAGFAPMAVASPAIRELELDVEWVAPDLVMAHPFPDGSAIALHRSVDETVASLGQTAGAGWRAAMDQMLPLADPLVDAVVSPIPPVRPGARLLAGLRRDVLEWVRRMVGSVEALGLDVFEGDRRATAWLAGSAQHSGLPPTTAGGGALGFVLQLLGHRHGWPFPRGGMQSLVDALVGRAQASGVQLRCDATVEAIGVRGGRVTGVRLRDGEELAADAVVSTVSAGVLFRMLPQGALPGRVERRLRRWRYGTGAFKVDYELSGPVPWTAEAPRRAAVIHVAGELSDLASAAAAAQIGEVPEYPPLVVGQQSVHDRTRVPGDAEALYVYAHVPPDHGASAERITARVDAQLERFAPGFGALVRDRVVRPPAQTERENPSLVGGDLAGGTMELDQLLIFRPSPELCRYGTPLRGLYLGGASVHPGGSVHGMSGRGAAQALLRDRKLRRA
jgi:phytoene dehydrogenase-like protein